MVSFNVHIFFRPSRIITIDFRGKLYDIDIRYDIVQKDGNLIMFVNRFKICNFNLEFHFS